MNKTTGQTDAKENDQDNRQQSVERSKGTLNLSPPPKAVTTAVGTLEKRRNPRYEKRVSVDLIPMTLEEIERTLEDARIQEEEKEIMEIQERRGLQERRKKEKRTTASAASPTRSN